MAGDHSSDQTDVSAWPDTPAQAIAVQRALAPRVSCTTDIDAVAHVAGVDVGFPGDGRQARAALALLSFPELSVVASAVALRPVTFPYIPGLLSFRELPAVLAALDQLPRPPDLLLVDGQGTAHPRRFGIACHLGVLTGLPCIGVGKTRLTGTHDAVPDRRGAWVPLLDRGEIIGAVLRSRVGVSPLFVSPGHRVSLADAVDWVMACTGRFRLPETTRAAHALASGGP